MAIETLGAALRQLDRLFADGVVAGLSDAQLLERFLSQGDVGAFEALVGRHGPMVLSVCRAIVGDPHDAEDAFQATFLILVQKGGTIRGRDALAGWLHRVAHRVANRANVAAARRRTHEREAGLMAVATSTNGPAASDDLLPALHEEIARLPEKYRLAVVHCDLEGMTQAQAAAQLHWSAGTIHQRLAEGRARLRRRLARRGLAPDGAALSTVLLREARASVPSVWREATVRAAVATVHPTMTVGVVSAVAKELTQEVFEVMLLQRLTLASLTFLAAGLIAWGASAALVSPQDGPSQKLAAGPNPPLQRKSKTAIPQHGPNSLDPPGKVTVRGRVLAPAGRPAPDAKLYRVPALEAPSLPYGSHESVTTGPDGRFQFLAVRRVKLTLDYERAFYERTVVAASAPNYGIAWVEVPPGGRCDDLTLQLVEDRPITGQIVDLEGKPVPGATLKVVAVHAAAGEDLGPWLEAAKAKKGLSDELEQQYLSRVTIAPALKFTADAEGRFRLTGIGRDRLVVALLEGPTIASQRLKILTRPGEAFIVETYQSPAGATTTYYGDGFRHVAAPTKPIFGVVRDADTKKPLAGITVSGDRPVAFWGIGSTVTDAQGRYRLLGMPKGEKNRIRAVPDGDQPYLVSLKLVPDSPGLDPVQADVELRRGVWIEGRIADKATGKPVQQNVNYFAHPDNPNLDIYGYDPNGNNRAATSEDGSYRLAGMPGPGMVAVGVEDGYLRANERDDEFGVKEFLIQTIAIPTLNYSAFARIDPARGMESVGRDITLDPGWTFTGTVLGPDGKPLAGAWGLGPSPWKHLEALKTAEFTVSQFNPHRPRLLLFQHPQKGLVGVARPPKHRGDSITVQLQPGATIKGRLIDADGRARPGVELSVWRHRDGRAQPMESNYFPLGRNKTDQQGRFRIEGLLPGHEFGLDDGNGGYLPLGEGLRSGQTKDLGDVTIGDE